jgi:hypothetical protein
MAGSGCLLPDVAVPVRSGSSKRFRVRHRDFWESAVRAARPDPGGALSVGEGKKQRRRKGGRRQAAVVAAEQD